MEECEVCGKKFDDLYLVDIEGAQMIVCGSCSKGKEILQEFSNRESPEPKFRRSEKRDQYEVVENYGQLIREARNVLALPSKVLAERINEKESTLVRVEKGEALPDDRLAKKLEKALGIKLIIKESTERRSYSASKQNEITLGDAAIIKKNEDDEGN